ncbi:hypothetical protein EFO90_09205 [Lactiplantibacillus plantarum]|uniref:hypothetical protein n=1 Tax=Lactiplantibacillus plantarum TaxID=1590 RepID=UPI0013F5DAFA|nr:hypothetical protein [Lactiplantibacillus plantarum]MCT3214531.1 hypothetical protein [Lactiplantibacillus plantarum]MCT3272314.1 hypothetical protein [Lactiplantibacillus plantarum]QIL58002.1 hypothetical protein EPJ55_10320 [Lactiplantibacillus plantarum]
MSFDLSEFLTEGLIDSINDGLIPSDLATVYAGNYLAKSLITQTQVTQVSDAITAYKAAQAEATAEASKEAQEADSSSDAQASSTADNNSAQ